MRNIEKIILRRHSVVLKFVKEAPKVISIRGIVNPPSIPSVVSIQLGSFVPVPNKKIAITTECMRGRIAKSLRADKNPLLLRDISATPPDIRADICTKKKAKARANPSSPKANKHKGKPILPLFGNTTVASKERTVPPDILITKIPAIAVNKNINIAAKATA